MKKILCLILAVVCALLAVSCRYIPPEETAKITDPSKIRIPIVYSSTSPAYGFETDDPSNTDEVIMRQVAHPTGISTKTIKRNYATALISLLNNLQVTDTDAPLISDMEFNLYQTPQYNDMFDSSISWLETSDKIYRLDWEYSKDTGDYIKSIALVEKHYGAGVYLQPTEELASMIKVLQNYWPFDYWYGWYDTEKDEILSIKHLAKGDSSLEVVVKNIVFNKEEKISGEITFEITSKIEQNLNLTLYCQQSADNFGSIESTKVTFFANIPQTVTLIFNPNHFDNYYITFCQDKTYIRIYFRNMDALYSE